MKRLSFHRGRTFFWAAQILPAVYVGGWRPEWERALFTYLIVISLAALVESAGTDWDQARKDEQETHTDQRSTDE